MWWFSRCQRYCHMSKRMNPSAKAQTPSTPSRCRTPKEFARAHSVATSVAPGEDEGDDDRIRHAQQHVGGVVADPLPAPLEHRDQPLEKPHGAQGHRGHDGLEGEERVGHAGCQPPSLSSATALSTSRGGDDPDQSAVLDHDGALNATACQVVRQFDYRQIGANGVERRRHDLFHRRQVEAALGHCIQDRPSRERELFRHKETVGVKLAGIVFGVPSIVVP